MSPVTGSVARVRLLLVDDEPGIVQALRRALSRLCPSWIILTATSVVEASGILDAGDAVDVVVTDIQMPGYSGDQLLDVLAHGRPGIVRITLSGMLNPRALRAARLADRWLCKPCPPERLRDEIIAAYRQRKGSRGGVPGTRRLVR